MRLPRFLLLCFLAAPRFTPPAAAETAPAPVGSDPVPGAVNQARAKQVNAIFKEWDTATTPGASVAVVEQGKVVFEKGYGIANLEYGVPIKSETVFHVASVSKQFTAMAVVLLESQGKLSIEDEVHKYLPELPDYGRRITLRNLLQHTSGIRDQWQTLGLAGWSLEDVITQDQILRLLFRQKELNFSPGSRHLYSNAGFTLLAEIVARVSGEAFPQFCADRIFKPLGMTHTHFHQDLTQLVPDRAYSYREDGGGYAASPLNYANVGATSLFTTAGDLAKWLDNFRDPKVGGAAGIARLEERAVLSDGTPIDYGLGLALSSYRGLRTVSHGGADAGYRSFVLWFPGQNLGIAVVSNLASFNPDRAAKAVASVYLGDKLAPETPKPEPKYISMEPRELEKYAGVYPLPEINQTFKAVVENGKLWAAGEIHPPQELRPVGPAHFYFKKYEADIMFTPKAGGGMGVKITQPGAINEGERVDGAAVETDLLQYTGVYWSEELETQYTFFLRDGLLFGLHAHHGEFALVPTIKDQFSTGQWFTPSVTFVRDSAGQITAVTLGGGRVKGVEFTRKPGGSLKQPSRASAPVSHAAMAAIVGRYDYKGPVLTVTQEGDRMFAKLGLQPKFEIFPKSETEYFWKVVDARVAFVKDADGKVVSATHTQNGRTFSAPRIRDGVEIKLDPSRTDPLLGDYDAGSSIKMTISRDGDRLFTRLTGQPRFELSASSDSELYLKQWNARLTVIKDKSGKVTGVISHQNGKDHEWPKLEKP